MNSWIPIEPNAAFSPSSAPDPFLRLESIGPLGTLDVLKLTRDEMYSIADMCADMDNMERAHYMLNPALKYFSVVEDFGQGTERIDFVPPVEGVMKNGTTTITPCAVACWENPNKKGVTGLGILLGVATETKTQNSLTFSQFCFIHNDFLCIDLTEPQPVIRSMREFYIGLQKTLYERPTLFRERTEKIVLPTPRQHKKRKKQKARKVKAYRVISIDPEQRIQHEEISTKRVITCPNYGVIGHWRQYKSGKRIWIRPYRKGKNRHNNSLYSAKEYQIAKEVSQCET